MFVVAQALSLPLDTEHSSAVIWLKKLGLWYHPGGLTWINNIETDTLPTIKKLMINMK